MPDDVSDTEVRVVTRICKGCEKEGGNPMYPYTCDGFYHPRCARMTRTLEVNGGAFLEFLPVDDFSAKVHGPLTLPARVNDLAVKVDALSKSTRALVEELTGKVEALTAKIDALQARTGLLEDAVARHAAGG